MKYAMRYTKISIVVIAIIAVAQFGQNLFCAQKKEVMVSSQGQVSDSVLELLKLTGVEHDGSIASIVKETQANWLRKPGQERWDIIEQDWKQRDAINSLFKKMGLIDEIKPELKQYDYALLMGATVSRMNMRLSSLIGAWQDGVRFNKVVLLSGARPLMQSELDECRSIQSDSTAATESDAMQLVYDAADMPEDMRNIPVVRIAVPMLDNVDGTIRRPTTYDTVEAWLKLNPTPGSCLVTSNQPYVFYQDSVAKSLLPSSFVIETFGQSDQNIDSKIDVHLDNLARCLYQEKMRLGL